MRKKTLATLWLGGCSGCHMSLLDIDERLLDVLSLADIVKSPIVDGKELPKTDIVLVEGAVASDEHRREILHVRQQAGILVSLGDCAVTGNVSSLRNFMSKEDVLARAYLKVASNDNPQKIVPNSPEIQKLEDQVVPLHNVVNVDYFLPGCPPSADAIFYLLNELLNDRIPATGNGREIKYG
jgi:NAD-reducing hydrogenase small subunit